MENLNDNLEEASLGVRLTALRESSGLTVDSLARVISISPAYVRALEEGDYAIFGAKVYARGVLKKILSAVSPGNHQDLMTALHEAWEARTARETRETARSAGEKVSAVWYLTPTRMGLGTIALLLIVFILFAGLRLIRFSAPPVLAVDEPRDKIPLRDPVVTVKGRTERESKLTVNGRELIIDDRGNFQETIELQRGVTALVFHSENRFGKSSTVTRYAAVE